VRKGKTTRRGKKAKTKEIGEMEVAGAAALMGLAQKFSFLSQQSMLYSPEDDRSRPAGNRPLASPSA